jgi:MFS transporter, MHS family, proline/betaine transporter
LQVSDFRTTNEVIEVPVTQPRISKRTQISAAVIGNALEWYDFTVYGTLAVTISKLFFPAGSGTSALLSTLAIFGVAYVIRPIGGLLFGHYADRLGRKNVLFVVIGTMTLGIAMIAFSPTYAAIGIAAPIIMLIARMIQGFSVGGEFATATTFLVEHAPARQRYLYGSWQFAGQGASVMLAGIVGTLVTRGLTPDQLASWGWRLPFIIGLVIGPVGFYMRTKLVETPEFLANKAARGKGETAPAIAALGITRSACSAGWASCWAARRRSTSSSSSCRPMRSRPFISDCRCPSSPRSWAGQR